MKTLREWRVEKAIGFNELVKMAGVTAQTLAAIESSEGRVPRFATMRKIAGALAVDVSQIEEFTAAAEKRAPTKRSAQDES